MATDLDGIKQTLINISKGKDLLDMLIEFERTLDNAELFAYKNWILGEVVEGPDIGRYFFKVTLMYPASKMPDPDGGLRLTKLGAKVTFKKAIFKKPVRVKGPKDWINPDTKKAKIDKHQVWLVSIDLPIKYIKRGIEDGDDVMLKDLEKTNTDLADEYTDLDLEQPEQPEDDMGQNTEMDMGSDQDQNMEQQ
jgi:hypothetical protein